MSVSTVAWVARPVAKRLMKWAEGAGITNPVSPAYLHATIVYDEAYTGRLPPLQVFGPNEHGLKPLRWTVFNTSLVLLGSSPYLTARFKALHDKYGMTHGFPHYQPHITFSKQWGRPDLPVHFPPMPIWFSHETSQRVTVVGDFESNRRD